MLLGVHTLVREFCRAKLEEKLWHGYLKDVSSFYMNHSSNIPKENKSLSMVLEEVEAAELLMEAREYEEAARILIRVSELLERWGRGGFLEAFYIRILPHIKGLSKACLLHNLGILYQHRGEYEAALDQYEKSLKIFKDLGDHTNVASSLHQIGNIHYFHGEYKEALDYYNKSLKIKENLGKSAVAGVASSLHQIGIIHHNLDEYEIALSHYEKSLKIAEKLDDYADMARSLGQIGIIHQDRGEYEKALGQYKKSLKILEGLGDQANIARSLYHIGKINHKRGEYEEALALYEKSLKIAEKLSDQTIVAASLLQIGMIHQERGEYGEAFKLLVSALEIFTELYSPDRKIALNNLIKLQQKWGKESFDAAWHEQTDTEFPDIFNNESNEPK